MLHCDTALLGLSGGGVSALVCVHACSLFFVQVGTCTLVRLITLESVMWKRAGGDSCRRLNTHGVDNETLPPLFEPTSRC